MESGQSVSWRSDCFIGGIPIMKEWERTEKKKKKEKKRREKMRNKKRSARKKWMLPG